MFGISELAILLIVLVLVFGAKKLPELARNAGKAARILKSEAKAMKKDDTASAPPPSKTSDAFRVRPGGGSTDTP
ncbi:Sec-independent protein translocase protein TatA [Streptomyces spiroverticillatus]|uniref:Sec-independent protein translocase protein TatA n=1 Tax=Streptomyces finlayi TaxID=67296 RepID=A0A919C9S4_9ACTN|nr:twin-arginine translocase TatA/TatE family subunit [Streptomyces finlayi]GHA07562.1 Sec-independent protein translocase protein TatA [Streptomyces spiroverticillatus]GHC90877.1 Sec-independent protein translocase protein TatA [Streptomyces finlayi]